VNCARGRAGISPQQLKEQVDADQDNNPCRLTTHPRLRSRLCSGRPGDPSNWDHVTAGHRPRIRGSASWHPAGRNRARHTRPEPAAIDHRQHTLLDCRNAKCALRRRQQHRQRRPNWQRLGPMCANGRDADPTRRVGLIARRDRPASARGSCRHSVGLNRAFTWRPEPTAARPAAERVDAFA
jgi:hypothetical protein